MGVCKDPVTTELNKRGYNLVKLPRVGIDPMDVLGRENNSMEKLGSIAEVWTSTAPVPPVGAPAPVSGVTGEKTSDLDVGIGLTLLADALAGLGAGLSLPSLSLAFKKARKVQFKFINVESTSITPFALGKFLANGTLDMSNPFVSHYFGNDETQEYIIFDVLKSDSISVTAKTETGTTVEADIGALSGALKANVSAKASSTSASEITFEGKAKATFAFKLFEVLFENGKWVPKGAKADDDLSFAVGEDEAGVATVQPAMISPGRLVRLR